MFDTLPSIDPYTGILRFVLKKDWFGSGRIRIVLKDDGGTSHGGTDTSTADTLTIVVKPVNDPPKIPTLARIAASIGGKGCSVGLKSADPVEANQATSYRIEPKNDLSRTCFAIPPSVRTDEMGFSILEFTPGECDAGVATFRLVAQDNGGTANGGVDTSETVFEIAMSDTLADARGAVYHYRKMGTYHWMLSDLSGPCTGCTTPGTAFYDLDTAGICPTGWRIPDSSAWKSLLSWASGGTTDSIGAYHLKSATGWSYTNLQNATIDNGGDNSTGFGLAANETYNATYYKIPVGVYWTSTPSSPSAYFQESVVIGPIQASKSGPMKRQGIRCIR